MPTPDRELTVRRLHDTADTWFGACGTSEEMAALVETAFLMAAADGQISEIEYEQLVGTILIVTGDRLEPDRVRHVIAQLTEVLQIDGWEARIQAVARAIRSPEGRQNAYRLAAGVSFIDHEIRPEELQLFGLLADVFQLPIPEATRLLHEVRDTLFGSENELTSPVIMLTAARRRSNPRI